MRVTFMLILNIVWTVISSRYILFIAIVWIIGKNNNEFLVTHFIKNIKFD